ncbi:MAG: MFS transporter [Tindallia sp. MSAO_Bac2]|nr:MAG: MFS transporter [Tindallia sp. MSAO_Bac2]
MKKQPLGILYAGIALAMVGYGIAMPLFPFYIEAFGGRGLHLGLLVASYGLMQLLFAPVWGALSDTYGRKPFLLLGMAGLSLGMILMGLASRLWMLYAAQIMAGALSCATYPAAMAMVSDLYSNEQRSAAMGRVGAAAGLGVILGPGLGGITAFHSLSAPFFIAGGFCLLTFLLMFLVLEESLEPAQRKTSSQTTIFPSPATFLRSMTGPLGFGFLAAFSINFGKSGFTSVYGLFSLEKFGYGPQEVGLILMLMSVMYALAQGVLVAPLIKKWGETTLIRMIFPCVSLGFVLILLANNTLTLVLSISFFMLAMALLKPTTLSYLSRRTAGSQGAAMGMAESFMSMGRIVGPLWAGLIFDINLHLPYLSGAIFFAVLCLMSLRQVRARNSYLASE